MVWSAETEDLLERLRVNCVNLSEYHRLRFYHFKSWNKYFRIPMLLLASLNSTASVGLQQAGVEQGIVSGITCVLGMIMGMITAVEMYLDIKSSMDKEMSQSKEYYTLATDIYKMLRLQSEERGEEGLSYLGKKFAQYTKLKEQSDLMKRKMKHDMMAAIPTSTKEHSPTPSVEDLEEEIYGKFKKTYSMFFGRAKHNKNELYIETEETSPSRGKDIEHGLSVEHSSG